VINHGSVQSEDVRAKMRPLYPAASEFFVQHGYTVVVPTRPGHGETGGPYLETNNSTGGCANSDYRASGVVTWSPYE
jgi:pimeloyl-ACP methyl ester carboxylesterase